MSQVARSLGQGNPPFVADARAASADRPCPDALVQRPEPAPPLALVAPSPRVPRGDAASQMLLRQVASREARSRLLAEEQAGGGS